MPTVAVIIPCHNGAELVPRAIDTALAQTFEDIEIGVADDRSSDNSLEKIEAYGSLVRRLRVDHGNTQAARNAAIATSDAEFVTLLDQDDRWHP